ncbi:hypothetical protein JCM13664_02080 [Methylothermus subterraneus]
MEAVRINFQFAVWLSVLGGLWVLFHPEWVFPELVMRLYGHVNLSFMAVVFVLVAVQVWLGWFHYSRPDYRPVLFMGGLWLVAALATGLFSSLTQLPVRLWLPAGLVYFGLSQLAEAWRRLKCARG